MGWETRDRGGSYYYTKERTGSRVRSVYVGKSETARLISQLEEISRAREETAREDRRRQLARALDEDAAFDSIAAMVETVTAAALLALGYHTHKREWRLIRGGKS